MKTCGFLESACVTVTKTIIYISVVSEAARAYYYCFLGTGRRRSNHVAEKHQTWGLSGPGCTKLLGFSDRARHVFRIRPSTALPLPVGVFRRLTRRRCHANVCQSRQGRMEATSTSGGESLGNRPSGGDSDHHGKSVPLLKLYGLTDTYRVFMFSRSKSQSWNERRTRKLEKSAKSKNAILKRAKLSTSGTPTSPATICLPRRC